MDIAMKFFAEGIPVPKGSMTQMLNPAFRKWLLSRGVDPRHFKGPQTIAFWQEQKPLKVWVTAIERAVYAHDMEAGILQDGPFKGAVGVKIEFLMPRPKGHYNSKGTLNKKGRETPFPMTRPDGDKLQRALLDVLENICYENDSRIVRYKVDLDYAEGQQEPGAYVTVYSME